MPDYVQPEWPAPSHVKACTTTRNIQLKPYPDDNRHLENLFELKNTIVWLDQTHGTTALPALPENRYKTGDALYTHSSNTVCAILTADCLPILICNQEGSMVAAIHAGWRGLAAGIIESTLGKLGQAYENLLVWFGPAIGPQKFEVGEDVYQAFMQRDAGNACAFIPHVPGKWLADLYKLARLRLETIGVTQIYGGNFCTYTQKELFFSYRRDHGRTGRMASLIWIDEK